MKILLLNPPTKDSKKFIREGRCTQEQGVWAALWPPISLAAIGAVLEQDGHEVRIADCAAEGIGWGALAEELVRHTPRFVIWSTGTPTITNDLSLASFIKKHDPTIATAVFGTHVSLLDRQCMEDFPDIDFIVRNEPEMTCKELAETLLAGKNFEAVNGVTFRNHTRTIIRNPLRPFIDDLDKLPFPAWHLLKPDRYLLPLKRKPFLMIAPQRGCPFRCTFCTCQTYYGKTLRKRSVEHVISEIEYDINRFGINYFFFWAETFVIDKNYVRELCSAILKRGLRIAWTCNSRVDTVDQELVPLMAKAGCWMISFGIESADQSILDETGKGTQVKQACNAVRFARDAGIKTVGHFMLGLPGETKQSMDQTIDFAKQLGLDLAQFYCAVPFPGSRLYEQALEQGWIRDRDFSNFRQDLAVMNLPTVSSDEINHYRNLAYRRFYLNLSSGYRTLKLMNIKDLNRIWASIRDFGGWSQKR